MKKQFLGSLLCLAMAGSLLAGCNMTDSTNGEETMGKQESAVVGSEADESLASQDAVELDLFIDFTWFPVDSWDGIIPEELTKNGGVKFNVTRAADATQLGLMIASGELPDVIFTSVEKGRLSDANLCYSYEELIKTYGVDWEPSSDRMAIAKSLNTNKEDDQYYTILQNYNTNEEWNDAEGVVPSMSCLYYRKDIWEALGSPKMETKEDIIEVCNMVKEQYPDMAPINAGNPDWRLKVFQSWFGAENNTEFMYTDEALTQVAHQDTSKQFYDFAKYVNQLYREGLFPEENLAITSDDDALQQAINGKCFMYEWNSRPVQLEQLNTSTQAVVADAVWAAMPTPDEAATIQRSNAGWAGVFISKNCEDPEAAIKMIAYLNSEEGRHLALWGREGQDYTLSEEGVPVFSEEWLETSKDRDLMSTKYKNNYFLCTTELDEAYTYYSGADPEVVADFSKNMDKIQNYPEISIALPVETSDMGIIRLKVREARKSELIKLYTAQDDAAFETAYENYMKVLDQIGIQELNEYMNEEVARVKVDFGF